MVASKQPCKCGDARESIESIMGRQDDIFLLEKKLGDGFEQVIPDFIRRAVMQMHPDITAYCAIQKSPEEIEIQLLPEGLQEISFQGFEQVWKNMKTIQPTISLAKYSFKPSTKKLRRIRRDFELPIK